MSFKYKPQAESLATKLHPAELFALFDKYYPDRVKYITQDCKGKKNGGKITAHCMPLAPIYEPSLGYWRPRKPSARIKQYVEIPMNIVDIDWNCIVGKYAGVSAHIITRAKAYESYAGLYGKTALTLLRRPLAKPLPANQKVYSTRYYRKDSESKWVSAAAKGENRARVACSLRFGKVDGIQVGIKRSGGVVPTSERLNGRWHRIKHKKNE